MGRFKSDAQRKAAFYNMSKRKRAALRRRNTRNARRIAAAFGQKPAQPTRIKVNKPLEPSDGKQSVVTCPYCGSTKCTSSKLVVPKGSTTLRAGIPQLVSIESTSIQNEVYYTCATCRRDFPTKPVPAP